MENLTGKTALITGAASGIGEALAVALDKEGMQLLLVDIEGDRLADLCERLGNRPGAFCVDVADEGAMTNLARTVFAEVGAVHLLVNNAGVMGPMAPSWDIPASDWDWILNVNVKGIANGIRAFVPGMLAQDEPSHIVNTASEASFAARAFVSVYHASKHAILALTESLAQELDYLHGDKIKVSVLCPAAVDTAVMDAQRNRPESLARPEDNQINRYGERLLNVYRKSVSHGLSAAEVARITIEGIKEGRFYLFPHQEVASLAQQRANAVASDEYPSFDSTLARLIADQQS